MGEFAFGRIDWLPFVLTGYLLGADGKTSAFAASKFEN